MVVSLLYGKKTVIDLIGLFTSNLIILKIDIHRILYDTLHLTVFFTEITVSSNGMLFTLGFYILNLMFIASETWRWLSVYYEGNKVF